LEYLSDDEDISRVWENIKENIKTLARESLSLQELRQHKPWFVEECFCFLDQRKQAKVQWLKDPSQNNVDNLNNVRRDASRHSRNKKEEYLKAKIEEFENNSKIKNIMELYRGIIDFKKGYQPRTNIMKDEKGDLVAHSRSNLDRWRKHFSQLLNIRGVSDVRQTAEPLVPGPSSFEIELAIEKLKSLKSPGIDQIPAELMKTGVGQFALISINLLFLFGIRKNCLRSGSNQSLYLPIRRAIKQNVVITGAYHFRQLRTKCYPTSCCQD